MPRSQTRKGRSAKFYCLSCKMRHRLKKQLFSGTMYLNNRHTCSGLTQHLKAQHKCHNFYEKQGLVISNNGGYDYCTSLSSPGFGLTNTANSNGLADINAIIPSTSVQLNGVLNLQVLYNGMVPHVPRSLIEKSLLRSSDNESLSDESLLDTDGFDFDFNLDCDVSEVVNQQSVPHIEDNYIIKISEPLLPPRPQLIAEIELMNLMIRHRMPLNAFKTIFDWAKSNQGRVGFDFAKHHQSATRTRPAILKEIRGTLELPNDEFEARILNWLPDNLPTTVYIRPFKKALLSLLSNINLVKEENFSFPDPTSPLLPYNSTDQNTRNEIKELHDGNWWSESWKSMCDQEKNEILVPIIFYMDSISLDAHGRLTLTPLNMTLGIFNTETRKKPEAWETVYFHPDTTFENSRQTSNPSPVENLQNLHNGIHLALESFRDVCALTDGIAWNHLPYANAMWQVRMKFAISFVIGDTEQHDKLCGKFVCRTCGIAQLCRHCNCPNKFTNDPSKQMNYDLWKPEQLESTLTGDARNKYYTDISHHCIANAFHKLQFGSYNPHNIHLASPGETLHMHQLGVAKRAVQNFKGLLQRKDRDKIENYPHEAHNALIEMNHLALCYGAILTRQSDRNFPRTKFSTPVTAATKKEGKDYAGMILDLIVAMLSQKGTRTLKQKARMQKKHIDDQVYFLELVLGMEEFLKHGVLKKNELKVLPRMIDHFVEEINQNSQRDTGMGNKIIKNHLYFHLPKYIEMWGPPCGWDSSFSESNHKTEIKAPSKNTQGNASSIIVQTAKRQIEYRTLQKVTNMFELNKNANIRLNTESNHVSGAKFTIKEDNNGKPIMKWLHTRNKSKASHPYDVLQFCCDNILPIIEQTTIEGFTEHKRKDQGDNLGYIFRCHPSYRSKTGQLSNVWYDWAIFMVDDKPIPCQILCFIELNDNLDLKVPLKVVQGYNIDSDGQYAVVRRFSDVPTRVRKSTIVSKGQLENKLYLFSCDSIVSEVAVVPDISELTINDRFMVIENRSVWLDKFMQKLRTFKARDQPRRRRPTNNK